MCISFSRVQNRYKEMDVIKFLLDKHIVTDKKFTPIMMAHDNGAGQRLSMVVATERC